MRLGVLVDGGGMGEGLGQKRPVPEGNAQTLLQLFHSHSWAMLFFYLG